MKQIPFAQWPKSTYQLLRANAHPSRVDLGYARSHCPLHFDRPSVREIAIYDHAGRELTMILVEIGPKDRSVLLVLDRFKVLSRIYKWDVVLYSRWHW